MSKLTHGQIYALTRLSDIHNANPRMANFATIFLGVNTAALLRKLVPLGLVVVTRGGRGSRQFFAITDAGRAVVQARVSS